MRALCSPLFFALALVGACTSPVPPAGSCASSLDCADVETCVDLACVPRSSLLVDAGPDAQAPDAGPHAPESASCPDAPMPRAEMARLILRALNDPGFAPAPATREHCTDALDHPLNDWLTEFVTTGFNPQGCRGSAGVECCPDDGFARGQAALWVLRAAHGTSWAPAAIESSRFADVVATEAYAPWVEALAEEGFAPEGCGVDAGGAPLFCPLEHLSRADALLWVGRVVHDTTYAPAPVAGRGTFCDDDAHPREPWIEAMAARGLAPACEAGCL